MKYRRILELTTLLLSALTVSVSCEDTVSLGAVNPYTEKGNTAYLRSMNNPQMKAVEVYDEGAKFDVFAGISAPVHEAVPARISFDASLVTEYNKEHNTEFPVIPDNMISIEDNGEFLFVPGENKSYNLKVNFKPEGLKEGTYLLPLQLTFESENQNAKLSEKESKLIYVIKYKGNKPSAAKESGFVTICYVECNKYNPLNAGEYFLENSKKPFIDIVNIFAANINYNDKTGKVYVNINKNIQYILDNRDKYIKPLQDKGIKVCLSILGNHDGSGVANLTDEDARLFAAELKAIVEAYGLDGVDFDDEWSDYDKYKLNGFAQRGPYPYARLCYEVKKAMPDKYCTLYYIGACVPDLNRGFNGFNMEIDGMRPGDFIDYAYYAQYGAWSEGWNTILGMNKKQWGPYSIDLQYNVHYMLQNMVDGGYGVQVLYDLRPNSRMSVMQPIAQKLYNENLIHTGVSHETEW